MNPVPMNIASFIGHKTQGREYTAEQITEFCALVNNNKVDEAQIGAWLMSVFLMGMTPAETTALTIALAASGRQLDMSGFPGPVVDKHSTGGVGDKVTLIIAPLLAAAGLYVPKLSGRGLGHTGGTIDKLESFPGFNCNLSVDDMIAQTRRIGLSIGAQTPELAPMDGRLYAIRDVTATVNSIALIAASVMSKKLAAGAPRIVLDVTCGRGAFMRTLPEAEALTKLMVSIGKGAGRDVRALITNMDEPLGCAVGNALEVYEAIEVLRGSKEYPDVREVVLALGVKALEEASQLFGRQQRTQRQNAYLKLTELLDSGAALEKFAQLVEAQGGDPRIVTDPGTMSPLVDTDLISRSPGAQRGGWIQSVDPMQIALASLELGAGRQRKGETIDPIVGIRVKAKVGDRVEKRQPLVEVFARNSSVGRQIATRLESEAFAIVDNPVKRETMVLAEF